MIRLYGLGGNWINTGLPMCVAIDRKLENSCEVQNCCDGLSGIMLHLKMVKTKDVANKESSASPLNQEGTAHGTKVLFDLVAPCSLGKEQLGGGSWFLFCVRDSCHAIV